MINLDADGEYKESVEREKREVEARDRSRLAALDAEGRRKQEMSPEERLALNRPTRIASFIARAGLVAWAMYYFIPQFAATWLVEAHGTSRAYTAFYWLANGFMLAIVLLVAWKYYHPLALFGFLPVMAACGYGMTRFFVDGNIALNMPGVIVSGIFIGILLLNLIFQIILLVRNISSGRFAEGMVALPRSKVFKVALVGSLAWAGITAWSYVGFNQAYTVRDFHQPSFSVSFWGLPSMDSDISKYNSPEGIAEMTRYAALNASFYFGIDIDSFASMASYEDMLNAWAPYNVSAIFNINPRSNITDPNSGDFCTYYHLQQMNDSIHEMMAWMATLNSTVRGTIRGLSFDVEGPNAQPLSEYPISRDQYDLALHSYQGILDEFQQNTSCTTHLISMSGILFDAMDGSDDHDIDIAQRTISTDLRWTQYGFMTYMIDAQPSASQYQYTQHCQVGVEQWGADFVPWVGWWYDVNLSVGETPQIELPGIYQMTLDQVKIAKSSGVPEVVLAPVRNYIGQDNNATKIQARLDALVDIKAGFESFTIPITNNMRIVNDWNLYWRKIVPYYVWSNADVVLDLIMGTPGGWLAILQGVFIGIVTAIAVFRARKIFK
jgi:hypothetical protein